MNIKLKKNITLPSNWKQCGHSFEDWERLNNGESIDVDKIPSLIEDSIDIDSVSVPKKKKEKGDK